MSFFFLMCSERSGSNFITKLMNGHSNICGPSTKHIFNPVARNLFRFNDLHNQENWHELLSGIYKLFDLEFSVWKVKLTFQQLVELAPVGDVTALLKNLFLLEAKANDKQHLFIKENQLYEFLPFLLLNFSSAKYVYLVRDPRDMALSWKKNPSHKGGVVAAAKQWKKDQQHFLKNHHLLAQSGKSVMVKYEDLISATDVELKRMFSVLGLAYEPEMLEFYKDPVTIQNASKLKAWNNLSKAVIKENKNKFIKELLAEEIMAIEKICFNEMAFLGYSFTFNSEELNGFSVTDLESLQAKEAFEIEYLPAEHVALNMEAKRAFYQR